ncbi:MAG TPA: glycosyltransferase family 4 protein [Candidatus Acidoferrales bacterium]|nr:glycosyltransferase family 4 protein [Candidatus Acidoferrales bacterium]
MKIAYVTDVIYPFVKGGAEKRIYEVSKRLVADNEVHVFGIKWWKGHDDIIVDGINIHGICKPQKLYSGEKRSFSEALQFAFSLMPMYKYDLDIIDCNQFPYLHCFPARLVAKVKTASFVITWHEFWGDYWYEYLGRSGLIGKVVEKSTMKLADTIIAVSKNTKKDLNRFVKNVTVIPNGVDLGLISSIKPSEEMYDVLFVGRLIPEKNVGLLLRSLPRNKSLGIIGEGPEQENLVRLSKELETNVTFKSGLPYEELIGLMKSADVLVLPSSREGFGIVALESLASGTPVITVNSKTNAAKDLITNGKNGFIVDLKPEAIKSAILKIDKPNMNKTAQDSVTDYDWNITSHKILNVYKSLIS